MTIYDIEDAKNDKATVPIYYGSRLAKLDFNREEIEQLDKNVEEVIEDEEGSEPRTSNAKLEHRSESAGQVADGMRRTVLME